MNSYPILQTKATSLPGIHDEQEIMKQSLYPLYAIQLADFQETLEKIREILDQDQLWPDQCDYIIHKLKSFQKSTSNISRLINSSNKHGKRTPYISRYAVIANAEYFSGQIKLTTSLVKEFRENTSHRSKVDRKQKAIIDNLHHLETSYYELNKALATSVANNS